MVSAGSLPLATTSSTMSRSVIMPLRRSSSPQIGIDPTFRSASFFAASATESFSPAHWQSSVMMSLAVLAIRISFHWLLGAYPAPTLLNRGSLRAGLETE